MKKKDDNEVIVSCKSSETPLLTPNQKEDR